LGGGVSRQHAGGGLVDRGAQGVVAGGLEREGARRGAGAVRPPPHDRAPRLGGGGAGRGGGGGGGGGGGRGGRGRPRPPAPRRAAARRARRAWRARRRARPRRRG